MKNMSNTISIVCLVTIITMGVICNTFAIVFLYTNRKRAIIKDIIIVILCIINLIQLIGYVIELYAAFNNGIGDAGCTAAAFIVCFCTYTAIGCFVFLMLERYTAIIYPFKYVAWSTRRPIKASCFIVPVIYGLLLSGAPLFGWGGYGRSTPNATYCAFDFKERTFSDKSFFFFVISLSFGVPLFISTICFVKILMELRRAASAFERQYGRSSSISRDSHKSINEQCISSLLTATIYIASWLPYSIVCFLVFYRKYVSVTFEYTAIYLAKSSTVTSPVVFCLIEKRVRRFIQKASMNGGPAKIIRTKIQEENDIIYKL